MAICNENSYISFREYLEKELPQYLFVEVQDTIDRYQKEIPELQKKNQNYSESQLYSILMTGLYVEYLGKQVQLSMKEQ